MIKAAIFIFGAIVGSFLNVCIHRLPRGESVVRPSSRCPNCDKPIPWHDNIPVLSYIALAGRCRFCKSRISLRYPIVEVLAAVMFLALFSAFGMTAKFFVYNILVSGLIIATFVDFQIREIPDEISLGGIAAGLVSAFIFPEVLSQGSRSAALRESVFGILAGGLSIYLIGFFGKMVFKKEAMGGGDVRLLAMIGSFLGWKLAALTFFIAPFLGVIPGIIVKLKHKGDTIAYGPYLALGAVISIFFGERISAYLFYGLP